MIRVIQQVTEDEMIAVFLAAELDSPRYAPMIRQLLASDRVPETLVANPDTSEMQANAYRRSVLSRYRGFGRNIALFHGYPRDVSWYRAEASLDDLQKVRYIDYDYWTDLSGGSRLAADAAGRLRSGAEQHDQTFRAIIDSVRGGRTLGELILIGRRDGSGLVVLEGHNRLTAYLLEPKIVPTPLLALIGLSDSVHEWQLY